MEQETINKEINKLVVKYTDVETLETRNSDSLDFNELSVWELKKLLEETLKKGYELGKENTNGKD